MDTTPRQFGWCKRCKKVQEGVVDKHNPERAYVVKQGLNPLTETSGAYAHPTSSSHERIVAIKELRTPWQNLWPPPVFNLLPRRQWTASRSPDSSPRRSTTAKRSRRDWILRTGWTSSCETSTTARLASDLLGGPSGGKYLLNHARNVLPQNVVGEGEAFQRRLLPPNELASFLCSFQAHFMDAWSIVSQTESTVQCQKHGEKAQQVAIDCEPAADRGRGQVRAIYVSV